MGRAAPFWLGAAGVLALDAAVGAQFWWFGEEGEGEGEGESDGGEERRVGKDERGRGMGRWRGVSGWMRGWVPSLSPARGSGSEGVVESVDEDERPLLEREVSRDAGYGTRGTE